jgi:glycosyltransferase GT-like protein
VPLNAYPSVRGEHETLRRVLAGASLARYGDGEFAICAGRCIPCQKHHPTLARRLREILQAPPPGCMVGIPNLVPHIALRHEAVAMPAAKRLFWRPYLTTPLGFLGAGVSYASAFVTRPDSAPWIDTPAYWRDVESLWEGREVTLVHGGARSLQPADLAGAKVRVVRCRAVNAFHDYDRILQEVGRPAIALLCLGPTATVLAADLAARGVHAVDMGHIGMFLRKRRAGQPLVVTAEDRASA